MIWSVRAATELSPSWYVNARIEVLCWVNGITASLPGSYCFSPFLFLLLLRHLLFFFLLFFILHFFFLLFSTSFSFSFPSFPYTVFSVFSAPPVISAPLFFKTKRRNRMALFVYLKHKFFMFPLSFEVRHRKRMYSLSITKKKEKKRK